MKHNYVRKTFQEYILFFDLIIIVCIIILSNSLTDVYISGFEGQLSVNFMDKR